MLFRSGDPEAAASACELALNRFPDFIPAIKRLAILNTDKPGYEQKVYDWAMKAHESLPDDLEISRTLGLITYRRGDFRSAARFLTESTRAGLADGKSLFYLGMAQFRLKSYKESKVALQRALALNLPADLADEAKKTLPQLK